MRFLRYYILYTLKVIARYKTSFLIYGLSLAIVITLYSLWHKTLFKETISEGVIGTYTEEDLPPNVTDLISKGLVTFDSSGKPIPNLVKGWEVSDSSRNYTFRLKDNLYWTDGTKLTSTDIQIPIPEAQITAQDDQTFNIKLSDSFSPLPTLLSKPLLKKGTTTGMGPYRISQITKDRIFITKLNLSPLNENLPNLVIRFYPSEKIGKTALRIGEVESLIGVSDSSEFSSETPFSVLDKNNYSRLVSIFYNVKDPILSDKNFRLALSYATPFVEGQTHAKTPIPPTSWAFNPDLKDHLNNPEMLKTYLKRIKNGLDKPVVLTSTEPLGPLGKKIAESWNKNGVKANFKVEPGVPQNFQALLIAQNIPVDPDQYSLWHSTQEATNISKYSSPRVDKDLEDSRKISDPNARKPLYADFQKVILDDAPAAFLYFPKYSVIYLNKIGPSLKKVLSIQLPLIYSG